MEVKLNASFTQSLSLSGTTLSPRSPQNLGNAFGNIAGALEIFKRGMNVEQMLNGVFGLILKQFFFSA